MSPLAIVLVGFPHTPSTDVALRRNWIRTFFPDADLIERANEHTGESDYTMASLPGEFPLPSGIKLAMDELATNGDWVAIAGASVEAKDLVGPKNRPPRYVFETLDLIDERAARRIGRFLRQPAYYSHSVFRTGALLQQLPHWTSFKSTTDFRLHFGVEAASAGKVGMVQNQPLVATASDTLADFRHLLDNQDSLELLHADIVQRVEQDRVDHASGKLVARAITQLLRVELGDRTLRLTTARAHDYLASAEDELQRCLIELSQRSRLAHDHKIEAR